jgi:hypothetical protein
MLQEEPRQDRRSGETGLQQRHKEPRPKRAITSGKREKTQQDVQSECRTGDRKENSLDFH